MGEKLRKVRAWISDRASAEPDLSGSGGGRLPNGVGWLHTLGYAVMALIVIQAVTGTALAMYYSPHPDGAYASMQYIHYRLPMGRIVHGLHAYGASAVIVATFLHLLRTFVHGAYKPPRELLWVLGVILFQLVLAFGFTGYLLPGDQKAYFATAVGTQYPAGIPVVGPTVQKLMRGGEEIGALTMTRFYAVHVLLLPMLLVPLAWAHVLIGKRKGLTPPGVRVGEPAPPARDNFAYKQAFRNMAAIFAAFGIVFLLAVFRPVELEFKANPSDPTYHPRPEWYFLSLFQLMNEASRTPVLKAVPEWLLAVALPGLAMTFLALAPWIDRGPERRAGRRPLMIGAMALGTLGVVGLTVRAYGTLTPNATPSYSLYARYTDGGEKPLDPALVARGRKAFENCGTCHGAYDDYAGPDAPDLTGYGRKTFLTQVHGFPHMSRMPFYERFEKYVRGEIRPPDTGMPKFSPEDLSPEDLHAIGAYLSQSLEEGSRSVPTAPDKEGVDATGADAAGTASPGGMANPGGGDPKENTPHKH